MKAAVITAAGVHLPRINASGEHEVLLVQDPLSYPKHQQREHPALQHDPQTRDGLRRYVAAIFEEAWMEVDEYRPNWVLVALPRDPDLCAVPIAITQSLAAIVDRTHIVLSLDPVTIGAVRDMVLRAGFDESQIVDCRAREAVTATRKAIVAFLLDGNFERSALHLELPVTISA